jgi:hypothetical protein
MSVTTDPTVADGRTGSPRRGRTLVQRSHWGYVLRLSPTATLAAVAAICCVWAVAGELDTAIERTTLAILSTVGLSIILVDAAAELTAPSVVALGWRRLAAGSIGVAATFVTWWSARALAAAAGTRVPMVGRWDLLEWSTIAASQLAVAAVVARNRPARLTFGPGLLIGLAWYVVVSAPGFHTSLFDPVDHAGRWVALLAAFLTVTAATSIDPAHRFHYWKVHR